MNAPNQARELKKEKRITLKVANISPTRGRKKSIKAKISLRDKSFVALKEIGKMEK